MRLFASISVVLLLATSAGAGSVRLRERATIEPGQAITLGAIATLDGEDATSLASTVVRPASAASNSAGWVEVDVNAVKQALRDAGAPTGRLAFSGRACTVRVRREAPPEPEAPAIAAPVIAAPQPGTIHESILRTLGSLYGVSSADLRATFSPDDAALLKMSAQGASRRVIVSPSSTPGASRAVMQVRVVDDGAIVQSRTIAADIELRRRVMVVGAAGVKRGQTLAPEALTNEERWVAPASSEPLESLEGFEGASARTRLEPGTVVRAEHLDTPIIVKRNELLTVYTVSAGFEVRTRARARTDARRGDVIEMRVEGSKRSFMARIDGPGLAVADLSAAPPVRASKDHRHDTQGEDS